MSATLTVTHKAIGAEVRRAPYDVVLDGTRVASVEMNGTFEVPVEAGHHTLQVRSGRNSSRTKFLVRSCHTIQWFGLCIFVHPADHNANLSVLVPGRQIVLPSRHAKVRRDGYRRPVDAEMA